MGQANLNCSSGNKPKRSDYNKWYKTKRWQKLRAQHLAANPYCVCPHHRGKYVPGDVVDHIKPHKGDSRMFWDKDNLQTLTKRCHDKYKQSEERGGHGFNVGCDINGDPLDKSDPWFN